MKIIKALNAMGLMLALGAANAFPDKPLKVIHGFAPGGGADIFLRAVVPKFSENLGQQVVIEYRVGAAANLAMEAVAKAQPDGYTMLMGTPGLATNPFLYQNLPFDPLRDLAPISLIGSVQNAFIVHPGVPAKTVKELIALAKKQPGKLNYASPGAGTSLHLAGELFKQLAGVDIQHVAYKGGAQAQTDLMGGQVQMMFNVLPSALPQIKSGKLRVLAVTGKTRAEALPDVPTMEEAGVPGYSATTWNGILTTAGTPRERIAKLNDALVRAMKSPEMKQALDRIGQDPLWSTPEEFAAFLHEETEKWRKVIQASGIKAQ
ncbi:MAG: tripartite tricarboxylate transporter substrate binding protein [Betaproteobacteria bacterium]|nr:MAG: tripartite tricarboxylate transporter substrate binding protein [Betaproteobacteria bacterium]